MIVNYTTKKIVVVVHIIKKKTEKLLSLLQKKEKQMFEHINNKYALISFIIVFVMLFILLFILRKKNFKLRYGNSELEFGGDTENESHDEDIYPFFTKMLLYRDDDLPLSFNLEKWNQFLGYHVCYILYTNYINFAQKIVHREIKSGCYGIEFMKVLEKSKDDWQKVQLNFNGYPINGIPPLMLRKFHQIRQSQINFLTNWITDIDCCKTYQNEHTKISVMLEVISFALTWIGHDYSTVLKTMNGDLDALCPDPKYIREH